LNIAVLAFACLWYGVVLPAHQRGAIRLPEPASAQLAGDCCHAAAPDPATEPDCHTPSGDKRPKSDPVTHCAVCQLVSVTAPPPVIFYDVAPLYLLAQLAPCPVHFLLCHAPLDPHSGRDPPAAA
jgi:hypothetical protein